MKFSCPHCSQHLEGDESLAGLTIDCPKCGKPIQVPSAACPEASAFPGHQEATPDDNGGDSPVNGAPQSNDPLSNVAERMKTVAGRAIDAAARIASKENRDKAKAAVLDALKTGRDFAERLSEKAPTRAEITDDVLSPWKRFASRFKQLPMWGRIGSGTVIVLLLSIAFSCDIIPLGVYSSLKDFIREHQTGGRNTRSISRERSGATQPSSSSNASDLCEEFVQEFKKNSTPHKILDGKTVVWDVGGENPPFIVQVSFTDDGMAHMTMDNTFFARYCLKEGRARSGQQVAQALEKSYAEWNKSDPVVANCQVKAVITQDNRLLFSGSISVSKWHVNERVTKLFQAMNKARGIHYFL